VKYTQQTEMNNSTCWNEHGWWWRWIKV